MNDNTLGAVIAVSLAIAVMSIARFAPPLLKTPHLLKPSSASKRPQFCPRCGCRIDPPPP